MSGVLAAALNNRGGRHFQCRAQMYGVMLRSCCVALPEAAWRSTFYLIVFCFARIGIVTG